MTQSIPPPRRPPVVLAGGSQFVRDQVARACAAAGVTPHFENLATDALALDPVVLIVSEGQAVCLSGQREVVVVGTSEDEPRVWGAAAHLASSRVVILPQGAGWLAETIGRRLNPAATGAVTGVMGVAGGCGASTFAYWCARWAAEDGRGTLLIDGAPLGGGVDLALGLEASHGVRWRDLTDIRGTLNAEQFAAALPMDRGVAVLSHDAGDAYLSASGESMRTSEAVLDAARGAFDVTVIDLGSVAGADRTLVAACDHLVLVVPSRPRTVAAMPRILAMHGSVPTTVVVRGPVVDGLDPWLVADVVGRPGPLPFLPFVRGAVGAEAAGRTAGLAVPRRARAAVEAVGRGWALSS